MSPSEDAKYGCDLDSTCWYEDRDSGGGRQMAGPDSPAGGVPVTIGMSSVWNNSDKTVCFYTANDKAVLKVEPQQTLITVPDWIDDKAKLFRRDCLK